MNWTPGAGGVEHGFVTNVHSITGEDASVSSGGFIGFSRSSRDSYDYIVPGSRGKIFEESQTPWMEPVEILQASIDQNQNYQIVKHGTHRIGFYSQGQAVDLRKLESRVNQLVSEIQAAIV